MPVFFHNGSGERRKMRIKRLIPAFIRFSWLKISILLKRYAAILFLNGDGCVALIRDRGMGVRKYLPICINTR
jgi:hypothetical protein